MNLTHPFPNLIGGVASCGRIEGFIVKTASSGESAPFALCSKFPTTFDPSNWQTTASSMGYTPADSQTISQNLSRVSKLYLVDFDLDPSLEYNHNWALLATDSLNLARDTTADTALRRLDEKFAELLAKAFLFIQDRTRSRIQGNDLMLELEGWLGEESREGLVNLLSPSKLPSVVSYYAAKSTDPLDVVPETITNLAACPRVSRLVSLFTMDNRRAAIRIKPDFSIWIGDYVTMNFIYTNKRVFDKYNIKFDAACFNLPCALKDISYRRTLRSLLDTRIKAELGAAYGVTETSLDGVQMFGLTHGGSSLTYASFIDVIMLGSFSNAEMVRFQHPSDSKVQPEYELPVFFVERLYGRFSLEKFDYWLRNVPTESKQELTNLVSNHPQAHFRFEFSMTDQPVVPRYVNSATLIERTKLYRDAREAGVDLKAEKLSEDKEGKVITIGAASNKATSAYDNLLYNIGHLELKSEMRSADTVLNVEVLRSSIITLDEVRQAVSVEFGDNDLYEFDVTSGLTGGPTYVLNYLRLYEGADISAFGAVPELTDQQIDSMSINVPGRSLMLTPQEQQELEYTLNPAHLTVCDEQLSRCLVNPDALYRYLISTIGVDLASSLLAIRQIFEGMSILHTRRR